jgi:GNAT superfamily N-acetyltransferase
VKIDVRVETTPSSSVRAQQLSAAFDVPPSERQVIHWTGDLPLDDKPWQVGLIVGPSGSGKTTIMRDVFGEPAALTWDGDAVVDDFPAGMSIEDITAACSAVGFNTIPAWLRPHAVLSNGEQFRVTLARLLAESEPGETIVVDEFTSVVDRQVAKIGAHAVAKWTRRTTDRRFVAVTCHYDVLDWLQPDWVLEVAPGSTTFQWRSVQPRPSLDVEIARVPFSAWRLFAPFHYLTAELNRAAQCFVLWVDGQPAAFAGVLHRPHQTNKRVKGVSRLVTLPDWQGLGLAFVLVDTVAAAYTAQRFDVHTYPAHPALIRAFDRSRLWQLRQKPATFAVQHGPRSQFADSSWKQGGRPNATFRYVGPPLDRGDARTLLS